MKAKIFAKLKQEYSALGLGDEVLMSRAESLAKMGLVTDENVDIVVAAQKSDLEAIQANTDKRVTDALSKERKKHEEEESRKAEEAKKKADEEASAKADAQAKREAEEAETKRKADEAKKKEEEQALREAELAKVKEAGVSDSVIEFLKSTLAKADAQREESYNDAKKKDSELEKRLQKILEASTQQQEESQKRFNEFMAQYEALKADHDALKTEAESAKKAKEAAERQNFIMTTAKSLGVPQWRIDEGFKLDDDATEQVIHETLSKVANNIRTGMLPSSAGHSFPISDARPTENEIGDLAKSIVK